MPDCPPRSEKERESDRWEFVVGKALKDWVTAIMVKRNLTRELARKYVLDEIKILTLED